MLPPTYAGLEAEGDGARYPGCLTPLGCASLRAPTYGAALAALRARAFGPRFAVSAPQRSRSRFLTSIVRMDASSDVRRPGGEG